MGIIMTNEDFLKKLNNVNKNIIPLEEYKRSRIKIKFKCLVDDYEFVSSPNNVLRGHGCPICGRKKGGENSRQTHLMHSNTYLALKKPNLSKCLKNKEDGMLYGYTSDKTLDWVCPICNYEFKRKPSKILEDKLVCPNCIKNDSYPNRFMFSLLKQLNVNFDREYSPEWIYPRRYDFYFEFKNQKYIVEMDGGFHRYEDVLENDIEKDMIAKEHNIEVIRIDCDYNKTIHRFDFIVENIIYSTLSNLFNFTDDMFKTADAFAIKNEVQHVCELWEQCHDAYKIKEETKLSLLTIRRYLRFANENGMCKYNQKEDHNSVRQKNIANGTYARSNPVRCDQTGEVFPNMKIAGDTYNGNVSSYFYQNRHYAGMLPDGTKLTWTKISVEEFQKIKGIC